MARHSSIGGRLCERALTASFGYAREMRARHAAANIIDNRRGYSLVATTHHVWLSSSMRRALAPTNRRPRGAGCIRAVSMASRRVLRIQCSRRMPFGGPGGDSSARCRIIVFVVVYQSLNSSGWQTAKRHRQSGGGWRGERKYNGEMLALKVSSSAVSRRQPS